MEKFSSTLKQINSKAPEISAEVATAKTKTSNIANAILKSYYPETDINQTTKKNILAIWNNLLTRASRKMSRIWMRLFEQLDKVIKSLYQNENTSEVVFTEFRKFLRDPKIDKEIYKQSIYNLGVSQERSVARKEEYKAVVSARNSSRSQLVPIRVSQILKVIQELKKSNNPYELAVCVELATGARSIEIFKVSTFSQIQGAPQEIRVRGLAKDKGQNNLNNMTFTRNLVGLTGEETINLVSKIRSMLNVESSNVDISNKTNRQMNQVFKKYMQPILKNNSKDTTTDAFQAQIKSMTSHKARYLQGNISFELFGKPKGLAYESYLQNQYGHLDPNSTKSYLGINIINDLKKVENCDEMKDYVQLEIKKLKKDVEEICPQAQAQAQVPLNQYKNSFSRSQTPDQKINMICNALADLKIQNTKMRQSELRAKLGYSADIMTKAYRKFRADD